MPRTYNDVNPDPRAPLKPLGAMVLILRPALWSGAKAEVVTVYDVPKTPQFGKHRVKIVGKGGDVFHTDCWASELKLIDDDPLAEPLDDLLADLNS